MRRTQEHDVGGQVVVRDVLGDPLCVQVAIVRLPGPAVDAPGDRRHLGPTPPGIRQHCRGLHPRRADDGNGALRIGQLQRGGLGGTEQIHPEEEVEASDRRPDGPPDGKRGDADVGDDRTTLLRQAGLVDAGRVQAVEVRGHLEDPRDGQDPGAADAGHVDEHLVARERPGTGRGGGGAGSAPGHARHPPRAGRSPRRRTGSRRAGTSSPGCMNPGESPSSVRARCRRGPRRDRWTSPSSRRSPRIPGG